MSTASDNFGYEFSQLSPDQQAEVMRFIREIKQDPPKGTRAEKIKNLAGTISREDAAAMRAAIEEGCEQIDPNGW